LDVSKNIYVGNLNYATTQDTLRELFEEYGDVTAVNVITDRETGRPRGFAFVEMEDDDAANAAIAELDGRTVDGRAVKVNEARPRAPRGGRGQERRRR
jgi:RNA recognition motif-containing protein